MVTIKDDSETCLVIKKSRFLTLACRVENAESAQQIIAARRKQHYDARHHCYAWLLEDGSMRYSDDGEPQGTAGLPILDVIRKTGLKNVLVITTRYFGGTLLGAGGLCRAYTQSASHALEAAGKVRLIPCSIFDCAFDFSTFSRVQAPLAAAGYALDDVTYGESINTKIIVPKGREEEFTVLVGNLTLGQVVPVLTGQKRMPVDI